MRTTSTKHISNPTLFKEQILYWSQQFSETIILDSNVESNENQLYKSYDLIVAVDAFTSIQTDYEKAFEDLYQYQSKANDWLFGYLAYDLKNDVEHLQSQNFDGLGFSDLYFFQPKKIFLLKDSTLEIQYLNMCDDEIDSDFEVILKQSKIKSPKSNIAIEQRISKENYIKKVEKTLSHIHRGDIYEANFCMEFFANNALIEPSEIYHKLNKISDSPFAVYFKKNKQYLLSASPERYLKKDNERYNAKMILHSTDIQKELDTFIDTVVNIKYPNFLKKYKIKNLININDELISKQIEKEINIEKTPTYPKGFIVYKEKDNFYIQYSKTINGKRYGKKNKIKSKDIQKELDKLIDDINIKYKDFNLSDFFPLPKQKIINPELFNPNI